jgi:hypothetical protein
LQVELFLQKWISERMSVLAMFLFSLYLLFSADGN